MRLRTQILIFFLIFGLTPLLAAVIINLPLVFGSLELFYQKAHVQNLRADFRDLDEHLASRHEMVRLLAKLPEPGSILGEIDDLDKVDLARARYIQWLNQILQDQIDIIQILFIDDFGQERFWLKRDAETLQWRPTTHLPEYPPEDFITTLPRMEAGSVLVSRIRLAPALGSEDPRKLMNLQMMSPITQNNEAGKTLMGSVVISIDVGGIAKHYRNTLWVNSDGSYLHSDTQANRQARAFQDFPGLEQIFSAGNLDLWKGPQGEQILWVPLFRTENSGPLWVGRQVDPSPLSAFRNAISLRVLLIVLLLIGLVLIMARWMAVRLERFGQELTNGIRLMLKADEKVSFNWNGPHELKRLGRNLTELAHTHAEHARTLREHARELEETNRYKSEFLANVSHELRTPLNSILLLSKLLAEDEDETNLTPEQIRQAKVIHYAGRDLLTLIDNILDHSRIEAREVSLHPEWVKPESLVQTVLEMVRPQFEQKGLYLKTQVEERAPARIRTDLDKLSQILKNFLANAVKFTNQGGVNVRVEPTQDSAYPLAIRVIDTGIGIPQDKHELIFEAFKQADGSTSRRHGGTGLGLSISRELAGLLGGHIELQSTANKGACFSLLLPLDMEQTGGEAPAALPNPEPVREPTMEPQSDPPEALSPEILFEHQCALVVASDIATLLEVTPMLERWGFTVTAAADGDEAMDSLTEVDHGTLVLIDAGMPDADACATIRRIREDPRYNALPIVAMTPPGNDTPTPPCLQAHAVSAADALLTRPLMPQALQQVLQERLTQIEQEAGA